MDIKNAVAGLSTPQIAETIETLLAWCRQAPDQEITQALGELQGRPRAALAALLRDAATPYLAAPVLVGWSCESGSEAIALPEPDPRILPAGLAFQGWLYPDQGLRAEPGEAEMARNQRAVRIATFTCNPDVEPERELGMLWRDVFREIAAQDYVVAVTVGLLPLPAALEAAEIAQTLVANKSLEYRPGTFLTDGEWGRAMQTAKLFRDETAGLFDI